MFLETASAQNLKMDVSSKLLIPQNSSEINYTKFLRITNNDHVEGEKENLSVLVFLNNSCNNHSSWNVTKMINSYSETGFGTLFLEEDKECLICASAEPLNFYDNNMQNNAVCIVSTFRKYNITLDNISLNDTEWVDNITRYSYNASDNATDNASYILNTSNVSNSNYSGTSNNTNNISDGEDNFAVNCSCTLTISTEKDIFNYGESVEYKISDCQKGTKFEQVVEYWIEDSTGIVKNQANTTSKTSKTYTPSISNNEKYFVLNARTSGCENVSTKIVVFNGIASNRETLETSLNLTVEKEWEISSSNRMIFAEVSGFKGESAKTLVSVWIEDSDGKKVSEITKFYALQKNSEFNLKLPIITKIESSGKFRVVVEGLGEKQAKQISIAFADDDRKKSGNNLTSNFDEQSVKETEPKILSFYTRKKVFSENITLYLLISNPWNATLIISTSAEEKTITNFSEKITVNISISGENEIIHAELYNGEALTDASILQINLTKPVSNSTTASGSIMKSNNQRNIDELIYGFNNSSFSALANISENKITGRVQGFEKIADVKISKSSILFILISIILGLFLFRGKLRRFLLKKTKLFK